MPYNGVTTNEHTEALHSSFLIKDAKIGGPLNPPKSAALFIVFKGGPSSGGPRFVPEKVFEILVCCR